jgi:hypothetical protein
MVDTYNGRGNNLSSVSPIGITSSTNASPIQITASAPHGLMTGDAVLVYDHNTNNTANGQSVVTVVDTTKFTLDGSTGTAAGGATGAFQPLITSPSQYQIPTDGEDFDATSINVALEHLGDRTALIEAFLRPYMFDSTPRIVSLATHTDTSDASNGSASPNSTIVELTNSRFTIDKLTENQIVAFLYRAHGSATGTLPHMGLAYKEYYPGASAAGFTFLTGSYASLDTTTKRPVTLFAIRQFSLTGGNLDVCLVGFTSGAGTISFDGDYSVTAVVFG